MAFVWQQTELLHSVHQSLKISMIIVVNSHSAYILLRRENALHWTYSLWKAARRVLAFLSLYATLLRLTAVMMTSKPMACFEIRSSINSPLPFLSTFQTVDSMRQHFKMASSDGFVTDQFKKRALGIGNYLYNILYVQNVLDVIVHQVKQTRLESIFLCNDLRISNWVFCIHIWRTQCFRTTSVRHLNNRLRKTRMLPLYEALSI